MASNTALSLTLQARDWELIVDLMKGGGSDFDEIVFDLQKQYAALGTKPIGTTPMTVATTEGFIPTIVNRLFESAVKFIGRDTGASPLGRIMSAIRAAASTTNTAGDTYLTTMLAQNDGANQEATQSRKQNGRRAIMMRSYDNV